MTKVITLVDGQLAELDVEVGAALDITLDGGFANSVYLPEQSVDGGGA